MIIWGNPIILKSGKTIFNPTINKNNFWVGVGANNASSVNFSLSSQNNSNSIVDLSLQTMWAYEDSGTLYINQYFGNTTQTGTQLDIN